MPPIPDWKLPPGVSRALWDYLHDADLAQGYDAALAGTPLLEEDLRFVAQHCPQPGRLLDLGCGTGRLLVPFAQRGYRVLGVDLSEEMLRVVGAKAATAGVHVDRLKANVVELGMLANGSFDYVACLFSTLGMVSGAAQRERVVAEVRRVLRPGGVFVLHVHNRWFSVWDRAGRSWLLGDLLRQLRGDPATGDRGVKEGGWAGLTLHHFSRREVVQLLTAGGFTVEAIQPVGLTKGGLRAPWWCPSLRAYGYLVAAK